MAIGTTDDFVFKYGTLTDLGNTGGAVGNAAYSDNNDLISWTNSDDAPMAAFVLQAVWGTAPTVGGVVTLHCQLLNVISTSNEPDIDSNFVNRTLGGWVVDNVTSTQYLVLGPVDLPNMKTSQEYFFYIYNGSGQAITTSTWKLHVIPMALGPHN